MGRRFYGVATDGQGRKYGGAFEAADEKDARRMLEDQGFKIISLEEIPGTDTAAENEVPPKKNVVLSSAPQTSGKPAGRARFEESGGKKSLGLWKPLAGAAALLVVIPAAITFLGPSSPEAPPEAAVQRFVELESAGRYEDQFRLFSRAMRERETDGRSYAARRGKAPRAAAAIEGMETVTRKKRKAEVEGLVRQGDTLTFYRWDLRAEDGEWKIAGLETRRLDSSPAAAAARPAPVEEELLNELPEGMTEEMDS